MKLTILLVSLSFVMWLRFLRFAGEGFRVRKERKEISNSIFPEYSQYPTEGNSHGQCQMFLRNNPRAQSKLVFHRHIEILTQRTHF
jgi:hypothetical protein